MRRALVSAGLTLAMTAGAVAGLETPVEPGQMTAYDQFEGQPTYLYDGIFNPSSDAVQEAVGSLPPIIQQDSGGIIQTIGMLFRPDKVKNTNIVAVNYENAYGSAFTITFDGIRYAITAGHVTNGDPKIPQATCSNEYMQARTGNLSLPVTIDKRTGTFDPTMKYTKPDLGLYMLASEPNIGRLPDIPLLPDNWKIPTGTILYNSNWQPTGTGKGTELRNPVSNEEKLYTQDQIAGLVLGKIDVGSDNDGVYAVLTGWKSYNGQNFDIPGSSGSPWFDSSDNVVGLQSGYFNNVDAEWVENTFGITLRNIKTVRVSIVQSVSEKNIEEMVERIKKEPYCIPHRTHKYSKQPSNWDEQHGIYP
jgi:hypothetical protein